MAYGKIKVDTLVYDNSGSDVEVSVSSIPPTINLNNYAPLAGATFTGGIAGTTGTFSGNVGGADGTFTGNVSGVNGTFSGNVGGNDGTFSGNVGGVNGTFSGNVGGVDGTFTGDISGAGGVFTGDVSLDGAVVIKGDSTNGSGALTLNCENNSHGIKLKGPPHSAGASYTLTFPTTAGSNSQFLTTNGSGVLSWSSPAGGISLSVANTWTAGQRGAITTLTSGATVTPDFAASNNYTLTLGQNLTFANPTNLVAGQSGSIFLVQDGTGSRTITWGSFWDWAGGTPPTLSSAAGSIDRLDYIVRTTGSIHSVVTLAYS